jgi:hypothetical protein
MLNELITMCEQSKNFIKGIEKFKKNQTEILELKRIQ